MAHLTPVRRIPARTRVSFGGELRRLLHRRDFRRLYRVRLVSQASDGTFQAGLAAMFFFSPERATDATGIAEAFAVLLLPFSVVGPFAGVLLDRWSRRQVLLVANALRAVLVLGVAGLVCGGVAGVPLYAAVLTVLSVNRFLLAGLSAALPHVVDVDELVMANSVSTTSGTIAALCGAGAGYGVRTLAGGRDVAVLVLAAFGYAVGSLAARRLRRDQLGPDDVPTTSAGAALQHVVRGLADGAAHVASHPRARRALTVVVAQRVWYGLSTVMTILLARNYFHDPADTSAGLASLAVIFAASGIGFLTAAVLTPEFVPHRLSPSTWIAMLLIMATLAEVLLGPPFIEPLFVAAAAVVGLTAQALKICVDTVVQQSVEDAFRGRVFALYDMAFNVVFVAAATLGALTLPSTGKSMPVLLTIGIGYAGTAMFVLRGGLPMERVPPPDPEPAGPRRGSA